MIRLLVILCMAVHPIVAGTTRLPGEAMLVQGLDLMYREQYRAADSLMAAYSRLYPDSPAGYLLRAGVIQYRCTETDERVGGTSFDSLVAEALDRADGHNGGGAWSAFFKGTAYGLQAFSESEKGNWLDALRRGLDANREFERAAAADPSLIDAYLGIGNFAYWRSRKTGMFNWLPFVGDRRDEGTAMVRECAERGTLNRVSAMRSLVEIFLDAGRYPEAVAWCDSGLKRYPGNHYFAWRRGVALFRLGDMQRASEAIEYELSLLAGSSRPNRYAEIAARMNLATAMLLQGRPDRAKKEWSAVLEAESSPFPAHMRDRAKQKFEDARLQLARLAAAAAK